MNYTVVSSTEYGGSEFLIIDLERNTVVAALEFGVDTAVPANRVNDLVRRICDGLNQVDHPNN